MGALSGSTAVLVLGMHRSGTSALGGLLQHAGINMGRKLFGPQDGVNERGFYENSGVVAINERLFDRLNAQWDQPQALQLPADFLSDGSVAAHVTGFLEREYSGLALWGLKDPRCALLEPLWSSAIRDLGARLLRILICRDPFEVADSLARRDHFPTEKSLMMWLNYNLAALNELEDPPHSIVTYAQLLRASRETLSRLASQLELDALQEIDPDTVIEAGLYRSRRADDGPPELRSLAGDLFDVLCAPKIEWLEVDRLRSRYTAYQSRLDEGLLSHLAKISRSEIHYRTLFYDAYDSWWWRAASPLRRLERVLRRRPAPGSPPRR